MKKMIKNTRSSILIKTIETMCTKPIGMWSMPMCFNKAFNIFEKDLSASLTTENKYQLSADGKKVKGKMRDKNINRQNTLVIFDTPEIWISLEFIAENNLGHGIDFIVFPDSKDKDAKMFYK